MEYKVEYVENAVKIRNLAHFDPEITLFCGQAFRWEKTGEHAYRGIAYGRVLNLTAKDGDVLLYPATPEEFRDIWENYFDLRRDYGAIQKSYEADPILKEGMAYAQGMRVLNQPPFEILISFILSANNNIRRITGIIERLCACFGKPISCGGKVYNAFPEPEALACVPVSALKDCGAGYRAPYVKEAAQAVCGGFKLDALRNMDYEEAKKKLVTIKGVGGKVADCILLYSLGFSEAFPMDVWIKRAVYNLYGCGKGERELRDFIRSKFGKTAGIAQQYLFHYVRKNKLGTEA